MFTIFSSANVNVCEPEGEARKTWDQWKQSFGDPTFSSSETGSYLLGSGALLLKVCSLDRQHPRHLEYVRNAESQALPCPTESESAFQLVPRVTPMHLQV